MTPRIVAAVLTLLAAMAWGQTSTGFVDPLRGPVPITETTRPPLLRNAVNNDERLPRNYDRQPPIIPHQVDGYQVDKNFNKCLDCHTRENTEFSNAIPVSASHYRGRDGKKLEHVSTRRYFCQQCHVAQDAVRPLVGNSFRGSGSAAPPEAARSDDKASKRATP
jgi:cytochrome c-type protein NapB